MRSSLEIGSFFVAVVSIGTVAEDFLEFDDEENDFIVDDGFALSCLRLG